MNPLKESIYLSGLLQVRVRLTASASSNRAARMTPRKRAAATEMSGICAMPDSPVAINRGTGRTAVGPCETTCPLLIFLTDHAYLCQHDICMPAPRHRAEKPVGMQSQLMHS